MDHNLNSSNNCNLSYLYSNIIKKYNQFSETIEDEFLHIIRSNKNNIDVLKELYISRNDIISKYNDHHDNNNFMVKLNEFRLQLIIHFEIIISFHSDNINDIPNHLLTNIIDIMDYLSFHIDLVDINEFIHPEESRLFLYYIKHLITPKYIKSLPSTLSYLYKNMEIDEYLHSHHDDNGDSKLSNNIKKKNDFDDKPSNIADLLLKMNKHNPIPSVIHPSNEESLSSNSNHNYDLSNIKEDNNEQSSSDQSNIYQFKIPSADEILRKGISNTSIKINSNLQKKSITLNRSSLQLMRKRKSVYTNNNDLSYHQSKNKKQKKM